MLYIYRSFRDYIIKKIFYKEKVFLIIESIKDYCDRLKKRYEYVKTGISTTLCYPEYFEGGKERLVEFRCPDIYIAELNNVYVYPETSILTDNKKIYCDEIVNDFIVRRCDFRGGAIKDVINDEYYLTYFKSLKKIEKGIWLGGIGSRNLFHLTLEILPKMILLDESEEYKELPLIMDEAVFRVPQLKELVELVNINKRLVIPVSARMKVKKLVHVSAISPMTFNVKDKKEIPEDNRITREAIFSVRERILGEFDIKEIKPERRIFCSRRRTNNMRLVNSMEVEKVFHRYGFEVVFTEDMSCLEQIKLFRSAKYVAGASGAAFTNIIYCHENTMLIHIYPEKEDGIDYPTIAHLVGMRCIGLNGTVVGNADTASQIQYECDLDYCERFLRTL